MVPTLVDGDDVLVDASESGRALRDGIYVLRRDETLMVKRLAIAPTSATLTISSDIQPILRGAIARWTGSTSLAEQFGLVAGSAEPSREGGIICVL